jgi:hypothetical protein
VLDLYQDYAGSGGADGPTYPPAAGDMQPLYSPRLAAAPANTCVASAQVRAPWALRRRGGGGV